MFRSLLAAALIGVLLCSCAQAQDAAADVRVLEDQLSEALVARDVEALDRLWSDDLIFIALNGRQFSKAERLAGQTTGPPRQDGETNANDEVDVRVIGDTAVATVVSTWTTPNADGDLSSSRYRALHVWTRDGETWRLLAAQVAVIRD